MSQKYTQDGVELVVAGLREFQNDLKKADASWNKTVQGFREGGKLLSEMEIKKPLKGLQGLASGTSSSLGGLTSGLNASGTAAGGAAAASG